MKDRIVYYITEQDLNDRVDGTLTEDQIERFMEAFPNTSVDQCIDGCLDSIVADEDDDETFVIRRWGQP